MWKCLILVAVLLFPAAAFCGDIHDYMRDVCVTVQTPRANGSGVVRNHKGESWIFTCGHVIEGARKHTYTVNQFGQQVSTPTNDFEPVTIFHYTHLNGLKLESFKVTADVIAFSSYEQGDVAILKIREKGKFHRSAKWSKGRSKVGQSLYHCGSPTGHHQSITFGAVTETTPAFDIADFLSWEGSSGGATFGEDGCYRGMVARRSKADLTHGYIIPVEHIKEFAIKNKLGFLFED